MRTTVVWLYMPVLFSRVDRCDMHTDYPEIIRFIDAICTEIIPVIDAICTQIIQFTDAKCTDIIPVIDAKCTEIIPGYVTVPGELDSRK